MPQIEKIVGMSYAESLINLNIHLKIYKLRCLFIAMNGILKNLNL